MFLSWIVGGYYYVAYYGSTVKPLIKGGATPWVHYVIMETKEHVFIFIPLLAFCVALLLRRQQTAEAQLARNRLTALLCVLIVVMAFSMAGLGFLISRAARPALGGGA